MLRHLVIILLFQSLTFPVFAIEFYSFISKDCQQYTGLTVGSEGQNISLITLRGKYQSVSKDDITAVLIFNVVTPPFSQIHLDNDLLSKMKDLNADVNSEQTLNVWPIKVVEDNVIFMSIDGRVLVYPFSQISKLRPSQTATRYKPISVKGRRPKVGVNGDLVNCPKLSKSGTEHPTRIIRDSIQIQDFLADLTAAYEKVESFQARTYFYARPMLYKNDSRFGFTTLSGGQEHSSGGIYYQWSGGDPYRYQSYTQLGANAHELTPNLDPVLGFRSEVKSHLFHGLVLANFNGIAAGSDVLIESALDEPTDLKELEFVPSYNYLGLIGLDYGPHSGSFGYFFPSFLIVAGDELREVLATRVSYVVRYMYTRDTWRLRVIGSTNDFDRNQPDKDDIVVDSKTAAVVARPDTLAMEFFYIRGGIDYNWNEQLHTSLDYMILDGKYSEVRSSVSGNLNFSRHAVSAKVKHQFGDYTALAGQINYWVNNETYSFSSSSGSRKNKDKSIVGQFEFIF